MHGDRAIDPEVRRSLCRRRNQDHAGGEHQCGESCQSDCSWPQPMEIRGLSSSIICHVTHVNDGPDTAGRDLGRHCAARILAARPDSPCLSMRHWNSLGAAVPAFQPHSSERTRMAPESGQKTIVSAGAFLISTRSPALSCMPEPSDLPWNKRAAPTPYLPSARS